MLTYWKITLTIAIVAALVWSVNRYIVTNRPDEDLPYNRFRLHMQLGTATDLLILAFIAFVIVGLSVEWFR